MSVVGLDWNATRALAVLGPAGDYPLATPIPFSQPGSVHRPTFKPGPPQSSKPAL